MYNIEPIIIQFLITKWNYTSALKEVQDLTFLGGSVIAIVLSLEIAIIQSCIDYSASLDGGYCKHMRDEWE